MRGSEDGPVVVSKDPQSSELAKRIRGISKPRMPYTGPPWLTDDEMLLIEKWIAEGAKDETKIAEPPKDKPHDADVVTYSDVEPVFKMRCVKCHSERGLKGDPPEGFIMSTYESILDSRGRARVVPGNSAASELVRKIRGQSLPRMPFDGPPYLSDDELVLAEKRVGQGALDRDGKKGKVPLGARVRLRGTLTDLRTLDGLPLQMSSRTEWRKQPEVGDYVEVRGTVRGDGSIWVERIRPR